MKTKTIIGIIAMLVACNIQIANSQTYWEVGGNNSTSDLEIGTIDPYSIIIKTYDLERMRINETGDVGIGTDTPTERLDVDGNVNVSGDYRINGLSILKNTGTGNIFVGVGAGENNTTSGTGITCIGYNASVSPYLHNATAIGYNACVMKSNSLVLGNNVNVGIGTDAPKYNLDVNGTIAAQQ